jgi:hypothetical protein
MTPEEQAVSAWAEVRKRHRMMSSIAKQLGIQPQAVWAWEMVPLHRMHDVARIAHMRWQDLRPDAAALPRAVLTYLIERAQRHLATLKLRDGKLRQGRRDGKRGHQGGHAKTRRKFKSDLKDNHTDLSTVRQAASRGD